MRSIATCYNEHAIKVSDSYCSGPSKQACLSKNLISIQNSVTCRYRANLSNGKRLLLSLAWFNNYFKINITSDDDTCGNSWQFRKMKGSNTFESCNLRILVQWDLSGAHYITGPEPVNGFYVMVLADSEICLLVGDMDEEAIIGVRVAKFSLISKRENFSGNSLYSTKAQFCEDGIIHDLLIRCGKEDEGSKFPVLSVCIDKKKVIAVERLHWNFRGNQSIFIDGLLVDMLWDVHDWFSNPASSGCAVFMFRTRSGLDSRLWFEERKLAQSDKDRVEFSFMICACKNPG